MAGPHVSSQISPRRRSRRALLLSVEGGLARREGHPPEVVGHPAEDRRRSGEQHVALAPSQPVGKPEVHVEAHRGGDPADRRHRVVRRVVRVVDVAVPLQVGPTVVDVGPADQQSPGMTIPSRVAKSDQGSRKCSITSLATTTGKRCFPGSFTSMNGASSRTFMMSAIETVPTRGRRWMCRLSRLRPAPYTSTSWPPFRPRICSAIRAIWNSRPGRSVVPMRGFDLGSWSREVAAR